MYPIAYAVMYAGWSFFFENHLIQAMLKNSICHKFCKWMDMVLRHTNSICNICVYVG